MAGYTRQSTSQIQPGKVVAAGPVNDEFNALQGAFAFDGHRHDGTTGNGPRLSLTASVTGVLPIANGGTGAGTASEARTNLGLEIGEDIPAYDDDIQEISMLTGSGVLARVSDADWALRSVAGTADEVTVTNGNGASGNPTISLPSALTFTGKTVTGGTFNSGTFSGDGSGLTSLNIPNIYVKKDGSEAMTGNLTISKSTDPVGINIGTDGVKSIFFGDSAFANEGLIFNDPSTGGIYIRPYNLDNTTYKEFSFLPSTGNLVLPNDPTVSLGAATKQYADTKLAISDTTSLGRLVVACATGNDMLTAMGFQRLLFPSGYWRIPGSAVGSRLTIQWGFDQSTGDRTITFPTPFSTLYTVVATIGDNASTSAGEISSVGISARTTTNFTIRPRYSVGGTPAVASQPVSWIAIGVS